MWDVQEVSGIVEVGDSFLVFVVPGTAKDSGGRGGR